MTTLTDFLGEDDDDDEVEGGEMSLRFKVRLGKAEEDIDPVLRKGIIEIMEDEETDRSIFMEEEDGKWEYMIAREVERARVSRERTAYRLAFLNEWKNEYHLQYKEETARGRIWDEEKDDIHFIM
eukprot:gene24884-10781_t